jgi:hypothetical protein
MYSADKAAILAPSLACVYSLSLTKYKIRLLNCNSENAHKEEEFKKSQEH